MERIMYAPLKKQAILILQFEDGFKILGQS